MKKGITLKRIKKLKRDFDEIYDRHGSEWVWYCDFEAQQGDKNKLGCEVMEALDKAYSAIGHAYFRMKFGQEPNFVNEPEKFKQFLKKNNLNVTECQVKRFPEYWAPLAVIVFFDEEGKQFICRSFVKEENIPEQIRSRKRGAKLAGEMDVLLKATYLDKKEAE